MKINRGQLRSLIRESMKRRDFFKNVLDSDLVKGSEDYPPVSEDQPFVKQEVIVSAPSPTGIGGRREVKVKVSIPIEMIKNLISLVQEYELGMNSEDHIEKIRMANFDYGVFVDKAAEDSLRVSGAVVSDYTGKYEGISPSTLRDLENALKVSKELSYI
jgi:hypothetical protein